MFVGRKAELARVRQVCRTGGALVVRGEAGIGKTALITAATEGLPVVRISGVEAELSPAYAGLHALVAQLPGPVPAAVAIAVGLRDGTTTDLATGTAVLRMVDGRTVVVDDAHHLDPASLTVLLFAARRLVSGAMIFAVRDAGPSGLPELHLTGLPDEDARKLRGPSASDALLAACAGNPLALLEADVEHLLPVNGTVPLADRLQAAFSARVAGLPVATQEALLDVAAGESRFVPALVPAERAGLVVVDGGVRFRHPLVRSAVYWGSPLDRRRAAHARLDGPWHRALAADGPDESLAKRLEHEAERLTDRGGVAAVAAILRRAAALSEDAQARTRRLAGAAYAAWKSGRPGVARDLLGETKGRPADEPTRRLLARLSGMVELYSGDQVTAFHRLVRAARRMPPDEAASTLFAAGDAAIHAGLPMDWLTDGVDALDCDPGFARLARLFVRAAGGRLDVPPGQVFDTLPRTAAASPAHRWVLPMALTWLGGDPAEAREFCMQACEAMREQGMLTIYAAVLPWLAELEFRLGHLAEAQARAEEGLQLAGDFGQHARIPDFEAILALVAAVRGDDDACRGHARSAVAAAAATGNRYAAATATWALGILALGRRDHARAADLLATLSVPGALTAHDLVARAAAYDIREAAGGVSVLSDGVVGGGGALVSSAVVAGGSGAPVPSAGAADGPGPLLPFHHARAVLAEGERLRRERHVADARARLRTALEWFERLGARRWAERAGVELAAAGGTPAAAGALTAQQAQIARLAGEGLSNKEIAARLFLSPRTVGYHLHNVFARLGVSARHQLRDLDFAADRSP
ncbi:LuxR C-terminal-related transcriptional regulator [Amycolatopsis sp. NEAU-NG30]|uniref:LuxR C-terminal-related transcriptional regulator n=1 Tax=Amycolatopsis melonis TaxID=3156488 RepID=A0ABV0LR93_9PSEU